VPYIKFLQASTAWQAAQEMFASLKKREVTKYI
jgi:hypothetical protein